jgi:hypothetical protein
MKKSGPGRPKMENTEAIKVHLDFELLAWLDGEVVSRERSRSYLFNEMVELRRKQLQRRRKGV